MTDIVERLRSPEVFIATGGMNSPVARLAADEIERLRLALTELNTEVCQRLGKPLGYPWFKDDQQNFPGATEENGVCTGEHVAESIAAEAARRIGNLEAERDRLRCRWMRVLQAENSCEPTDTPCKSKRCGCLAEMETLIGETGHD
jgi:hypothetical protein